MSRAEANVGLNPVLLSNIGRVFTLHCSGSRSWVNEYLAIDIGGYLYTNSLCELIAVWLDASQRSRDGV